MARIIKIDHVALVVDNAQKSLAFWRDTLGLKLTAVREEPAEATRVAFLPVGESQVELLEPTLADSGIARYLVKRGPGMHHLCLEVDDLEEMLLDMKNKGVRLITEQPRTAPDGRRYAFIHPEATGGVLLELYESL